MEARDPQGNGRQQPCAVVRPLAACGTALTIILMACVSSGALDAELRDRDPPRKMPHLRRPGGFTVFLAWPRQDFKAHCALLGTAAFCACLLQKHPFRKWVLPFISVVACVLLYGPVVQRTVVGKWIADPVRLVLTWDEFASRHGCTIEKEPSIRRSLAPYREKCSGRISASSIREAVRKSNGIGISIKPSHEAGVGRQSHVAVFGSEEAKGRYPDRLWHWFLADLQALTEQVQLPTVDFLVVLQDGFESNVEDCVPTFVQEKKIFSTGGVLAPPRSATGIFDLDPSMFYLYDRNVKIASRSNAVPFKLKLDKAFFRGSTTGAHFTRANWRQAQRSKIVQLSLERPDLLDARFTGSAQKHTDPGVWEDMVASGFTGPYVDQSVDVARHKMVVVPDGNSVPDRLMSLLASDVVVLKPKSVNIEYWYDELVPWQHYIPFREDTSDLQLVLEEARANASRLEYIAGQATEFVMRRLNPSAVACYWALLLREYQTLLNENATQKT